MWQMAIQSTLSIMSEKYALDSHSTQLLLEMSSQEWFVFIANHTSGDQHPIFDMFFIKSEKVKWLKN